MFDRQYGSYSWKARLTALAVVVIVHLGLLFVTREAKTDIQVLPPPVVHFVDIPIVLPPPPPESQAVSPKFLELAPPSMAAPELSIEAEVPAEATDHRLMTIPISSAPMSSASPRSIGAGTGGGQGHGDGAGHANGSGPDIFANCKRRVMPTYPASAKTNNQSGKVVLLVELDETGRFASIKIAQTSGSRALDAAGIDAIRRWKCSPVIENGRPIRAMAKQEFEFTMR
jgi:protein TonB